MASQGLNPYWIGRLKQGDPRAVERLWDHYWEQLTALAVRKLHGRLRVVADQEDIALSVLRSVARGAKAGEYSALNDADDLEKILRWKVRLKLRDHFRHYHAGKRDEDRVQEPVESSEGSALEVEPFLGREPMPAEVALAADLVEALTRNIKNDRCRCILELRLQRFTTQEIAAQLGLSTRTVDRELESIRRHWQGEEANA